MQQYHDALRTILEKGEASTDRTGTGTVSYFGMQSRYDLAEGFPMVTTKKLHQKSIIHELLWFLSGDTNIRYLLEHGVRIWTEWPYKAYTQAMEAQGHTPLSMPEFEQRIVADAEFARAWGGIGPAYGAQWRNFNGVDQIQALLDDLHTRPDSRRHIVSAWNPAEVPHMALPPCHTLWQVRIAGGKLHLQLYQRSADMFLGVPFNIASYALLAHMLAHVTDYEVGTFVHTLGDAHIYTNHLDQVHLQLTRTPKALPTLRFARKVESLFDFRFEDVLIEGYDPDPAIKAPVAV